MNVLYRSTGQGNQTRSQLLGHLNSGEELSREELIERSGLTYDQIRRQTKNLSIEGLIVSRLVAGKRVYRLSSFIVSSFIVVCSITWSVSGTVHDTDGNGGGTVYGTMDETLFETDTRPRRGRG